VIEACFAQLEALVGTAAACRGSGRSRATHYRRLAPPVLGPPVPRGTPANALSEAETVELLGVLRSPRFCDLAPAQVWAILLDEGRYPGSISTMYRVLRASGEVRERRAQAKHPARARPELMADHPNMCWSWDITKLRGPDKGVWYDCYYGPAALCPPSRPIKDYNRPSGWIATGFSATVANGHGWAYAVGRSRLAGRALRLVAVTGDQPADPEACRSMAAIRVSTVSAQVVSSAAVGASS